MSLRFGSNRYADDNYTGLVQPIGASYQPEWYTEEDKESWKEFTESHRDKDGEVFINKNGKHVRVEFEGEGYDTTIKIIGLEKRVNGSKMPTREINIDNRMTHQKFITNLKEQPKREEEMKIEKYSDEYTTEEESVPEKVPTPVDVSKPQNNFVDVSKPQNNFVDVSKPQKNFVEVSKQQKNFVEQNKQNGHNDRKEASSTSFIHSAFNLYKKATNFFTSGDDALKNRVLRTRAGEAFERLIYYYVTLIDPSLKTTEISSKLEETLEDDDRVHALLEIIQRENNLTREQATMIAFKMFDSAILYWTKNKQRGFIFGTENDYEVNYTCQCIYEQCVCGPNKVTR